MLPKKSPTIHPACRSQPYARQRCVCERPAAPQAPPPWCGRTRSWQRTRRLRRCAGPPGHKRHFPRFWKIYFFKVFQKIHLLNLVHCWWNHVPPPRKFDVTSFWPTQSVCGIGKCCLCVEYSVRIQWNIHMRHYSCQLNTTDTVTVSSHDEEGKLWQYKKHIQLNLRENKIVLRNIYLKKKISNRYFSRQFYSPFSLKLTTDARKATVDMIGLPALLKGIGWCCNGPIPSPTSSR